MGRAFSECQIDCSGETVNGSDLPSQSDDGIAILYDYQRIRTRSYSVGSLTTCFDA